MRFEADIFLKGTEPFRIPSSYRRNLMSLIKETLRPKGEESDIYRQYYGKQERNRQKPFTFSVSLPIAGKEKGLLILGADRMRFYFSSCDPVFLIHVYNGLVGLDKDFSPFPGYGVEVRHFHLQKDSPIDSEKVLFKTYSPVLVRDLDNKKGKGTISYDKNDEGKFEKNLLNSVENLCRNFLPENEVPSKSQISIKACGCCEKVGIQHYAKENATKGTIQIEAPRKVLQLIYDAGLGAKRSQGFGMVEVAG